MVPCCSYANFVEIHPEIQEILWASFDLTHLCLLNFTIEEFKGCLVEIYNFIQILKVHSIGKQCRTWLSDLVQPMSHKMDARLYGLKWRDYTGELFADFSAKNLIEIGLMREKSH